MSKVKVYVDPRGMDELRNSIEMQSVLGEIASGVASRCGEGYSYEVSSKPTRAVAKVYAESSSAFRDNMKNNTLLRALG